MTWSLSGRRAPARISVLLVVALATAGVWQAATASPAHAAPGACTPSPILVNSAGPSALTSYGPDGSVEATTPLLRDYGDIALAPDGVLYGVGFPGEAGSTDGLVLYTIDKATGSEVSSVPLTGAVLDPANFTDLTFGAQLNSLSALPGGDLLVGSYTAQKIFRLDPTTGETTLFGAAFPADASSGGDFLSLPDGDILAVGILDGRSPLYRISPDLTVTQIGTLPLAYGAAQNAGAVFLALADGAIVSPTSLPQGPSTAPLDYTTIATTGLSFYGATSAQDAGLCPSLVVSKTVSPASTTPVAPGETLAYTLTFDNTAGTASAAVLYTDDLTGVVDDAAVTVDPVASGGGVVAGPVRTTDGITSFTITGDLAAGASATVTYSVRVNTPVTGDGRLDNHVIPSGTAAPTNCEPDNAACTSNPVQPPISAGPGRSPAGEATLAATGADAMPLLAAAASILGVGLLLTLRSRRRGADTGGLDTRVMKSTRTRA